MLAEVKCFYDRRQSGDVRHFFERAVLALIFREFVEEPLEKLFKHQDVAVGRVRRGRFVDLKVERVAQVLQLVVRELAVRIHGARDAERAYVMPRHDVFLGEHGKVELRVVRHDDSLVAFEEILDLFPFVRILEGRLVGNHFVGDMVHGRSLGRNRERRLEKAVSHLAALFHPGDLAEAILGVDAGGLGIKKYDFHTEHSSTGEAGAHGTCLDETLGRSDGDGRA